MRISTKGRGIIRAQQGAVARPNPKENLTLLTKLTGQNM